MNVLIYNRRVIMVWLLFFVALVGACVTPRGRTDLLNFIEDGKTTREQTVLQLGEPAAFFEEGRILCFRLGHDGGGAYVVGKSTGFAGVETSLVMVFNEQGVLIRHSQVQVKGP